MEGEELWWKGRGCSGIGGYVVESYSGIGGAMVERDGALVEWERLH